MLQILKLGVCVASTVGTSKIMEHAVRLISPAAINNVDKALITVGRMAIVGAVSSIVTTQAMNSIDTLVELGQAIRTRNSNEELENA